MNTTKHFLPTRRSLCSIAAAGLVILAPPATSTAGDKIIHDAEHYILEAQHGERWAKEDKQISARLAEIRKSQDGKPPNIVYILLDDLGFGEIGMPNLDVIRGYSTPRIARMADEGLSFMRMYTEPSCTPTRAAMLTGRYAMRTGTSEAKATIAGDGLSAWEVTIAEVLGKSGYATVHMSKWHLGDIEESLAVKQGFDYAEHPMHQQGQMAIMNQTAELEGLSAGLSRNLRTDTFEIDKPFFLQYWPQHPLTFTRSDIEEAKTLNGGPIAESLAKVDSWIGEILDKIDTLGIAENTVVVVMGDNGPFMQYVDKSGASDRIYRGGKAEHLEGGVRVNAFMKWRGVIEPGTRAQDIFHVSDLFTTFARLAGAEENIPTDRLIDGVDQTPVILLGETHGRRDYVFIYEGPTPRSIVKQQYKFHLPLPGANPIGAPIFDLYKNPREDRPQDAIQYGVGFGGGFVGMFKRHMGMKQKYPDRKSGHGLPYGGIDNLRPESKALVESMAAWMKPSEEGAKPQPPQ